MMMTKGMEILYFQNMFLIAFFLAKSEFENKIEILSLVLKLFEFEF